MFHLVVLSLWITLPKPALGLITESSSRTFSVYNGHKLLLRCTPRELSSISPIKSLIWTKDNVTISANDSRLNSQNGTLLIEEVREEDAGTYICTLDASGYFITSSTTFYVIGFDSPTPPPQNESNKIVSLQKEIDELLRNLSALSNISSITSKLTNLTKPRNERTLSAKELSASVETLAQLVNYNSRLNDSAINTTAYQQNIVQVASNLLEEKNTPTWLQLQESRSNITDDFLKAMDDFGSQVGSQLEDLDNSTYRVFYTSNVILRVDRFKSRKKLSIDFSQHGATLFVPGEVFSSNSTTQTSTIVYKTLHNILRLQKEATADEERNSQTSFKSGSNIVSATILPRPFSPLERPIKLALHHKNKTNSDVIGSCVFWQIGLPKREWSTRGCMRVEHESNAQVTTCACDHLTIFALLMNNKPVETHHEKYLQSIATIGCTCSLLFLLLTIILIAFLWKYLKSPRVKMLLHLCIAIAASCALIVINDSVHLEKVWCTVIAALLHYFLLGVFTWMFCHGVMLYLLIIKAELRDKLESKMKWFYSFGWGFPLVIVVTSLVVTGAKNYVADNCWLNLEQNLIWGAFVIPVAIIVLVNSVLFITLLCRINKVSKFRESMTRAQHVKAWLRRSIVLLPVLGVTWSFGLLTFVSTTIVFHYLFTIFNSLQGFVIFFNFCVLDTEVRALIVGILCKWHNASSINKRVAEPVSRNSVHRNNLQVQAVTDLGAVPTRIQAAQNEGFYNMDDHPLTSARQEPKLQTWMTSQNGFFH